MDSREQNQDYICDKLKQAGVETIVTCLQHGVDYMILGTHGTVGVQRKTFPEVAQQMKEIRTDIVPNLMDATEYPILLVEETFNIGTDGMMWRKEGNFLKQTTITARMYYNFLQSIRQMGCEVVTTRNLDQSIWWMYSIHAYIHDLHYPKQDKRYKPEVQAIGALCCINSFGPTAATKALKDHTISDLMQMSDTQLLKLMTVNQVYNFKRVMFGQVKEGSDVRAD